MIASILGWLDSDEAKALPVTDKLATAYWSTNPTEFYTLDTFCESHSEPIPIQKLPIDRTYEDGPEDNGSDFESEVEEEPEEEIQVIDPFVFQLQDINQRMEMMSGQKI